MEIREELLAHSMAEHFRDFLYYRHINWENEINTIAVQALDEIQKALHEYNPASHNAHEDWLTLEKIIEVFRKYDISTGSCHDF